MAKSYTPKQKENLFKIMTTLSGTSVEKAADELNRLKLKTPRGLKWSAANVGYYRAKMKQDGSTKPLPTAAPLIERKKLTPFPNDMAVIRSVVFGSFDAAKKINILTEFFRD